MVKGSADGKGKPKVAGGSWDGNEDEVIAGKVRSSLKVLEHFWSEETCQSIEAEIENIGILGRQHKFKPKTLDRTPLRSKYFFGYGYTYGSQISKKGGEQLLPPGMVDEIPEWIRGKLIRPLEEKGIVAEGWINSAVVNDYRPGGMIVSHIDPPKLFARPIFINSFFADGRLVFGSRFSFPNKGGPPETTPPKCICAMPRASVTIMDGFSADGITHGIRPDDLDGRRVSIVLRHVFVDAPTVGDPDEFGPVQVPQFQGSGSAEKVPRMVPPPVPAQLTAQPIGQLGSQQLQQLQCPNGADFSAHAQLLILAKQMMQGLSMPNNELLALAGQQSNEQAHVFGNQTNALVSLLPQIDEVGEIQEDMAKRRKIEQERHRQIDEDVDDYGRRKHKAETPNPKQDTDGDSKAAVDLVVGMKRTSGRAELSEKQKAALARLHQRHQKAT